MDICRVIFTNFRNGFIFSGQSKRSNEFILCGRREYKINDVYLNRKQAWENEKQVEGTQISSHTQAIISSTPSKLFHFCGIFP